MDQLKSWVSLSAEKRGKDVSAVGKANNSEDQQENPICSFLRKRSLKVEGTQSRNDPSADTPFQLEGWAIGARNVKTASTGSL
jgi:hypothetical protein